MFHGSMKRCPIFVVSCLIFIILDLSLGVASADETAVVHLDPKEVQVGEGQTTTVAVRIEDVEALYGLDIRLGFDPEVVEVVDADPNAEGVQLSPGDLLSYDFSIRNTADNAEGTAWFAMTQVNPSEPVTGSGTAFSVTFKGKVQGTSCPIAITYAKLSTRDGTAIPADTVGGTIKVVQPRDMGDSPATETPSPPRPTVVTPTADGSGPSGNRTPEATDTATSSESTETATAEPTNTALSPTETATPLPATDTPTPLAATETPVSPTAASEAKSTLTESPAPGETKVAARVEEQNDPTSAAPRAEGDVKSSPGGRPILWLILGGAVGLFVLAWGVWAIVNGVERVRARREE